jgi:VanZ family protein
MADRDRSKAREAALTAVGYALPPLAWMAGIFLMGSDVGSAEHSRGWLEALLEALGAATRLSPAALETANLALRKLGHFLCYAFLAILLARLARRLQGARGRGSRMGEWESGKVGEPARSSHSSILPFSRSAALPLCPSAGLPLGYPGLLWAWAGAVAQAAADEFHQSFFPSRGASAWDVALDSLGAAAGILFYRTWISRPHRKRS